jgi:hypothetical protein
MLHFSISLGCTLVPVTVLKQKCPCMLLAFSRAAPGWLRVRMSRVDYGLWIWIWIVRSVDRVEEAST